MAEQLTSVSTQLLDALVPGSSESFITNGTPAFFAAALDIYFSPLPVMLSCIHYRMDLTLAPPAFVLILFGKDDSQSTTITQMPSGTPAPDRSKPAKVASK